MFRIQMLILIFIDISVGASFQPTQDESSPNTCQTEINPAESTNDSVKSNPNPDSSESSTPVKSSSKATSFFNSKMSDKKPPKSPDESDCKYKIVYFHFQRILDFTLLTKTLRSLNVHLYTSFPFCLWLGNFWYNITFTTTTSFIVWRRHSDRIQFIHEIAIFVVP